MIRRRGVVQALAAALALPARAFAQPRERTWRVGFLSPRSRPPTLDADYYGAFPRRMRELGYVEGRNLVILGVSRTAITSGCRRSPRISYASGST